MQSRRHIPAAIPDALYKVVTYYMTFDITEKLLLKKKLTFERILHDVGTEFGRHLCAEGHCRTAVDLYEPRFEVLGQHEISTVQCERTL